MKTLLVGMVGYMGLLLYALYVDCAPLVAGQVLFWYCWLFNKIPQSIIEVGILVTWHVLWWSDAMQCILVLWIGLSHYSRWKSKTNWFHSWCWTLPVTFLASLDFLWPGSSLVPWGRFYNSCTCVCTIRMALWFKRAPKNVEVRETFVKINSVLPPL